MSALKRAGADWWFDDCDPPQSCSEALRALRGVTAADCAEVREARAALHYQRSHPAPTILGRISAARLRRASFPFARDLSIPDDRVYTFRIGASGRVQCGAMLDAVPYRNSNGAACETEDHRRQSIIRAAIASATAGGGA